ncbi:hypothetical protein A2U01_0000984 [Trifolium medium]|uniref:RRM domain-containing protein n=1 Tax=Trifolium medium TaxID=97028 RepID=A0A392LZ06_9FABA|nr:hypothetical protein [Trifolium medium]
MNIPQSNNNTFFFTNFPDGITVTEIWESFARYWRVGEVYIPAKRDKFGRRFGFARFADVRDAQELLKKIEGTWFGTYKLRANLSRFKRGEDESGSKAQEKEKQKVEAKHTGEGKKRNGKSFKEMLTEGGAKEIVQKDKRPNLQGNFKQIQSTEIKRKITGRIWSIHNTWTVFWGLKRYRRMLKDWYPVECY